MKAHLRAGTALAAGFVTGSPELEAIRSFFSAASVTLITAGPADTGRTAGSFFGLRAAAEDPGRPEAVPEAFRGKALIFGGFSGRSLNAVLDGLGERGLAEDALKAAVTQTNAGWTLGGLLQKLAAERDAFARQKQENEKRTAEDPPRESRA